uniref:RAB11 family interacting protein 1 (class I) a n=1 Tax=Oryzias latipes TaxID=8090 RepID=A0A3P9JQJ8_ORYLA
MSLLGQSQQLFPTSVQVTVHQARNLRVKGKNGGNDAYAIMQVAKDKFSTSVAEKSVAPVWKEEASFDLPLFHPGNAERCTLYIIVMHRAQVGLDKFLGQAVINLLELHDDKSRKKTQWFKLVDKNGKEDKVRGEVMLDIQFMRNNLSVSMLDLSMQDKPRSRISKLKDKVRGKKKDGFSDSASAIVPSVSKTDLTDSEEDADAKSLNQAPGAKKKSKLKTLFVPKSNLHRNISQSMSTLGTLPEKNSSLSASRSSGLDVDSPEGKKKFKFLGHKRSGSSDSKTSLGPFSVLGRSKQNINDQNNLCINGNHVYTEESKNKSGSTLSLNSSGKGSLEDIRKNTSDIPAESSKTINVPAFKSEPINKVSLEQQRHQEAEERRQAEEKRLAEVRRREQEEKYRAEAKKLQEEEQRKQQEEQERRRRVIEDEARRKKQNEEERRREEERKVLEASENQRFEDERGRAEERKRQEEASMSDRLTSLFGMIRKKEEKKEDVQQQAPVEQHPTPATRTNSGAPTQSVSHRSTNPFEDTSGPSTVDSESSAANQKFNRNPQAPSATVFLSRTAKVSAVKPRPHPVKPMSSAEIQQPTIPPAVKEIKVVSSAPAITKMADSVSSGPYGQLTQEELISLVVKQQADLSKKDAKISELEQYIDNLLVRVMEEKPTILFSLNSAKQA